MKTTLCVVSLAFTFFLDGCSLSSSEGSAIRPKSSTAVMRGANDVEFTRVELAEDKEPGRGTSLEIPGEASIWVRALEASVAARTFANLAQQRSSSQQVTDAARILDEHYRQAEARLRAICAAPLPANIALSKEHQQIRARLENLRDAEFDKGLVDALVVELEATLTFQQTQANTAPTEALRVYFAENSVSIQAHLLQYRDLQGRLLDALFRTHLGLSQRP